MFTKIFVLTVLVVICVSGAPPSIDNPSATEDRRCYSRFEEWNECGPSCPPTCDDLFNPDPKICTAQCVPSCVCKEGYIRNQWNNCVRPSKCQGEIQRKAFFRNSAENRNE